MPYYPFTNYGGSLLRPADERPVANRLVDDKPVGMLIRYVGGQESGTVTVSAAGDITFKHGAVGAEANDTSIGGAADAGATLDVSVATEDTFGECVDLINATTRWQAVLIDVLRSDSSNDTLATLSATQAKLVVGLAVVVDTSVALKLGSLVAPQIFRTDIRVYERNYQFMLGQDNALVKDGVSVRAAYKGFKAAVVRLGENTVFGGGASNIRIINEDQSNTTFLETEIFTEAGGATGVEKTKDFSFAPVVGFLNGRVIARVHNTTTLTDDAGNYFGYGGAFSRSLS